MIHAFEPVCNHRIMGLIFLFASAAHSAGQDAGQVAGGRRLIETERKTIFFAMHPTARLTQADYDGVKQLRDGFVLTYSFQFKGIGGNYYSRMDFVFNDKGRFFGLKTNYTTSLIDPFLASNLAMGVFKDMVKEDLELNKDGAVAKAIEAADARLFLELLLAYKQTKLPAAAAEPRDEQIVKLIRASESMDEKERAYWIRILPQMTAAQRGELRRILEKEREDLDAIDRKYRKEMEALAGQQQQIEKGYQLLRKADYRAAIGVFTAVIETDAKSHEACFFRGQAFQGLKDYKAALADYTTVIGLAPKLDSAYQRRAHCRYRLKNYRDAYLDYARSAELTPKSPQSANNLAWFLATCPEARFRDGKDAVAHATRACELTSWKDCMYMDTLAAAYAESGNFEKAVEWQTKALEVPAALEKAVGKEETEQARRRLGLFKEKKSFREGEVAEGPPANPNPKPNPNPVVRASYSLTVKSGTVAKTKKDNKAWDFGLGKIVPPDPYVKVRIHNSEGDLADTGTTNTAQDTYTPVWNQVMATVKEGWTVKLEAWDKDGKYDDEIGKHEFKVTAEMLKKGEVVLSFGQMESLKIEFTQAK